MGRLKQLLLLGSKPVVRHCVDSLLAAGISDIVVVCGVGREKYAEALAGSGADIVCNEQAGTQMADSVRLGLRHLEIKKDITGILVLPADHPMVNPSTCRKLMLLHHQLPEKIIIPRHEGRRGHPTLFPRAIAHDIFAKNSLREIVREDEGRVALTEVQDEGVVLDMDTEDVYQKICTLYDARTKEQGALHVQ